MHFHLIPSNATKVVMNLLLPLLLFHKEIGFVLPASELFTIYFTISAEAISLSPSSGRYEGLTPPFLSHLFSPHSSRSIYSVDAGNLDTIAST